MAEIKSTCCYCGVGCGVIIRTENVDGQPRIVDLRGDPDHPSNRGRLCTKGATLHLTVAPETQAIRAQHPELRTQRSLPRRVLPWADALNHAAERFATIIQRHGPDSVAFYVSGQLLTEDYYVFNKLVKGLIGTNNIDSNSRLCMSSATAAYKDTLGVDAPPCCYDDIAATNCLLLAGSNAAYAHPIVFRRIEDARMANPEMRLIVVDPRRTDTAAAADLHLAIRPGSDVALYHAMLHVLLREGLVDRDYIERHTQGFGDLAVTLRDYTPAHAAEICGLGPRGVDDIVKAAQMFGSAGRALSLYCQGLNQSTQGVNNNAALIHLHLATGKIGKPGCGPFSLTGQPNAMGGRETGSMANLLPGHRDLAEPRDRQELAALWGVDALSAKPGLTAVELFAGAQRGEIKAIWIAATNPAHSMPELAAVRAGLRTAEFVVVQDAYAATDTTEFADLLLPAASWGEKEGCMTNSERRISRVRAALAPPGNARPDWLIAADFARRLGTALGKGKLAQRMFAYASAEDVFTEHRATTLGRDLDIGGISYALLDRSGPQQWPFPVGARAGVARLYGDGRFATPSGRARFVNMAHAAPAEDIDAAYPLRLTSGRLRDQWHGMSRTGSVARLYAHQAEPRLEMHAEDMMRYGVVEGELVRAVSRRGALLVRAQASDGLAPGLTFMAMHWGSRQMNGLGVNVLTSAAFDPVSKQPELKHAAIRIEKLQPCAEDVDFLALRRVAPGAARAQTLLWQARLQPWLQRFTHATLTLAGREDPVLVVRGKGPPLSDTDIVALDRLLGFASDGEGDGARTQALSFKDARRRVMKRALIEDDVLTGVRLIGETAAAEWLKELMASGASTQALRPWLLAPLAQVPAGGAPRGKVVCACFDVAEAEITAEFAAGCDLPGLQAKRKCGTSCGSCLPELKRLADRHGLGADALK